MSCKVHLKRVVWTNRPRWWWLHLIETHSNLSGYPIAIRVSASIFEFGRHISSRNELLSFKWLARCIWKEWFGRSDLGDDGYTKLQRIQTFRGIPLPFEWAHWSSNLVVALALESNSWVSNGLQGAFENSGFDEATLVMMATPNCNPFKPFGVSHCHSSERIDLRIWSSH